MADKPSRALVLYATGHAALLAPAPAASESHLDAFASRASCGFLTLRSPPPSAATTGAEVNSSTILELAQLLDVYDHLYTVKDTETVQEAAQVDPLKLAVPKLSDRFMGLRAAMVTNCPHVSSFAANLGFHVLRFEDLVAQSGSSNATKEIGVINGAFGLLGFSDGNVQEASEFDLVFMHVAMDNTSSKLGKLGMKTDLNRLEKFVGAIMEGVPTGSAIATRIHVSVLLSYGSASEKKDEFSISNSSSVTDSDLNLLRPRQSCTMKAGHALDDVRLHHPVLLTQWQEGVTRVDMTKRFSFDASPSSSSHLPGEPPPLSREEVMAVKKAKSSSSSTLPGKQSHTQNGHGLPSKLARYLDPDASWDKDQLLDALHWIRQVLGLVCGLLWGAIPLVGAVWIALFMTISTGIVYWYYTYLLKIDEEDFGGHGALLQEGLFASFTLFLLSWTLVYSLAHF